MFILHVPDDLLLVSRNLFLVIYKQYNLVSFEQLFQEDIKVRK